MKKSFSQECKERIKKQSSNTVLQRASRAFVQAATDVRYAYNFEWLGRPIIQHPEDIVALQEIIWNTKPDLIIETGIAHGGSLVFSASMLELLGGNRRVVGVDIDIRRHNRKALEKHPMRKRISMLEGSSIDPKMIGKVKNLARNKSSVMVVLDSNHSHDHVLKELELYSPLVTKGNYIIVFDTVVEKLSRGSVKNRPWCKGSNPFTAVQQFLKTNKKFAADTTIDDKILITCAPGGFLKRIR